MNLFSRLEVWGIGERKLLKKIFFFPANNLYGHAQCKPLPVGEYRWLKKEEIQKLNWKDMSDIQVYGYILEVDLIYPSELHASHNSFPLAPVHEEIKEDVLSPYAAGMY